MGTKITVSTLAADLALAVLNQNFSDLANEFDNVVYRDGTSPNALLADLDLNSNRVINLADGTANSDAVNLRQLNAAAFSGEFTIASATDGDTTPSVDDVNVLLINNTSPTTITNFDDPVNGQVLILVIQDVLTTIQDNANIDLRDTLDYTPSISNESIGLVYISSLAKWIEFTRQDPDVPVQSFVDLDDTPGSLTAYKMLAVNSGGTALAEQDIAYDIGVNFSGTPGASENIMAFPCVRSFRLPQTLPNSQAKAKTAATAETIFTIKKNGGSIGTITFAASGTTGTFSFTGDVDFVAGDVIDIDAPVSADATIAGIHILLAGIRRP